MLEVNRIYNADCMDILKELPDKSIDCIICDLPYGTTAIACHNLKRRFICIERDTDYYNASLERLKNAQAQLRLF